MTEAEFDKKWKGISTDDMTDEQFVEFKNDCFEMSFKVLRRATTEECDLEAMPIWYIEFENGDTAYCYPEEICKSENE